MARFPYVRWTIIALFVGAMVINYLARSVLGVAAPAIMAEQSISSAQYSWITGAFQLGIRFQPLAGYLLDVVGLKIGFTQIAGLVARRILAFVAEGDSVTAGERIGLIRFGSRVDVYLPAGTDARVVLGQTVIAGETVLAEIGRQALLEGVSQ